MGTEPIGGHPGTATTGPLAGYRVLDLSQVVSGPFATMLLADQGADVIKVEPSHTLGDVTRLLSYAKGGLPAFYINNNRGKRAIAVDLQTDAGREIVLELAAESDVVVQNFRPGAIDRLGLGYADVCAVNPDVIYCSISGFGPDGPYSHRPVLDPVIQGLAGVISRQLNPEIPFPDLIRNLYADKSTALTVAQAITAGLLVRERTGAGQHIEVPMIDACLYFFWPDGMMDKTLIDDDVSPGFLLSSVYSLSDASDGKFVYFVASDPQRHALYDALDRPEWKDDPRFCNMLAISDRSNFEALGALLAKRFAEMTVAEVLERLWAKDVPSGPILDADQMLVDEQIRHNGTLVQWQHPLAGTVQQPRPAARFSLTPAAAATSASIKGGDTDQILSELGRSGEQIAALRADDVVC
jgi:crotonobetainyl-CoA:carnitine CoA-transferase CaiB-like acyl-CoA transferase